ncbi:MAG: nuclear transport factor 2 family protein [Chloroflexi bacterium]|nr:nuclear transport factor 2 family protein [Chloroflexota bacterium]
MKTMSEIITSKDWDRFPEVFHEDAVMEYPQSREMFRGLTNIRAQFENYPEMGPGTSELAEVIGDETFALTPSYTVIRVEGSGLKGTAVIRIRYPDGSYWWAINLFELRDGRIRRSRSYFAPDFEAPDWRAPYREAP